MVQELIEKAKSKYPISIYYTGRLSEEEITILEKTCDVKCPSIYMNGSATYSIRYKERISLDELGDYRNSYYKKNHDQ